MTAISWNNVLNEALEDHSDVSFLVSAGDQVNYGSNEREYAGYLGAKALTFLPVATTIGNHDSVSNRDSLHFNNPNAFSDTDTNYIQGKTKAGTDYYYRYGNVLFIVLDTNNYNCATHENVMKKQLMRTKMSNGELWYSIRIYTAAATIILIPMVWYFVPSLHHCWINTRLMW